LLASLGLAWRRLRGRGSPRELAISVALGLFVGCLPFYGFHFALCLLLCWPFRLDVVAAYVAAQISNPWFAPALIVLEARIGGFLLGRRTLLLDELGLEGLGELFERTLVGSLVVGVALGLVGGAVTWFVAARSGGQRSNASRYQRTLARYREQSRADRWYVDLKLRSDPVALQLAELGPFGRVIDAGAGRGQIGLWLHDLGSVASLSGFDPDARKVLVAAAAAAGDASYSVADLQQFTPPAGAADSVLLIDVLHYLEPAAQRAALSRVKTWLAADGRLFVREVDARPGLRSAFTRGLERLATAVGYNQATRPLGFRPLHELVRDLEALGFVCELGGHSAGTPFANTLIVAKLPLQRPSER
jgi:uncharacterized protein (DUF2062 family)